jgi:S-DNA-T family DNA segregation ATPase FtsK/SpoIIIE
MPNDRKIGYDISAVVLLTLIVFLVASLATYDPADPIADAHPVLNAVYQGDVLVYPANEVFRNSCGLIGAWLADVLVQVFGVGAYYLVIGLISLEIKLFQQRRIQTPWFKTVGWLLSLIGLTACSQLLVPAWTLPPVIGSGGYLGALVGGMLKLNLGVVGGILVAACAVLVGVMMWTEYLILRAGRVMFAPAAIIMASHLPFGILAGWMKRVNRRTRLKDNDVDNERIGDYVPARNRGTTIRIRNRKSDVDEVRHGAEPEPDSGLVADEDLDDTRVDSGSPPDSDERLRPDSVATTAPSPHVPVKKPKTTPVVLDERDQVMHQLDEAALVGDLDDYELPSMEMLVAGNEVPFEDQEKDALRKAKILENTCKEFGYNVSVVEVETGPVISQYEIQLEAGLRLQKITALSDDLAIALRVPSVRIVAPIPGKNTVGVEVPNEQRQVVRLREVMEQSEGKTARMNIPLFLGNDAVGAPMVIDLAKMPHLLIAGRTGTGKSVCLNAIICSILMTRRPDEVRMLMIDPKMVELSGYARLPHLMHPVVTDMRKAEAILAWAVDKMEERYHLLARAGVRHINSYNQLGEEELMERLQPESDDERREIPSHLPFIVIVADEMADLMMTAGKEVEQHIIRLAQKSRAVGIHLVLATQKPTVDVITGLIKSNLPARLAFQVASKMDSRVVLDAMGAEKLLGSGDMLFLWPGTSTLLRGQGTFLSDEEIDAITDSVSTGEQNFVHELVNIKIVENSDDHGDQDVFKQRDELYADAIQIVVNEQRGSLSLLQRALGIGYGRAARLIDFMEEDGYVGAYNGSKSRDVLLTPERWAAIRCEGITHEQQAVAQDSPPMTRIEKQRQSQVGSRATTPIDSNLARSAPALTRSERFVAEQEEDFDDDFSYDGQVTDDEQNNDLESDFEDDAHAVDDEDFEAEYEAEYKGEYNGEHI